MKMKKTQQFPVRYLRTTAMIPLKKGRDTKKTARHFYMAINIANTFYFPAACMTMNARSICFPVATSRTLIVHLPVESAEETGMETFRFPL